MDAMTAEQVGLRGSPTILIGGRDPFPGDGPAFACRLYPGAVGPEGAPAVTALAAALRDTQGAAGP